MQAVEMQILYSVECISVVVCYLTEFFNIEIILVGGLYIIFILDESNIS